MAGPLRKRLRAAALAGLLTITTPVTGAVGLTVFDPSVYAQLISAYQTAQSTLSTVRDTYNSIASLYSEISGYINFATNIIQAPDKFLQNTVSCLFSLNFGPLRTRYISLCDTVQSVVSELTLAPQGSADPTPQGTITQERQQEVTAKRQTTQQENALRAIALGRHARDGAADAANDLRDLQIAASAAQTLVPITRVNMQAAVFSAKELQMIRALLAQLVELQGSESLRQTPLLFSGSGQATTNP